MSPKRIQHEAGRDESKRKVEESLIHIRAMEQGMCWKEARDFARRCMCEKYKD